MSSPRHGLDIPEIDTWDDVDQLVELAESIVADGPGAALLRARGLRSEDMSEARLLAGLLFGEVALAEGPGAEQALGELAAMLDDLDDVMALFGAVQGIGYLFRAPGVGPALAALVDHDSFAIRQSLAGALHSAHEVGDSRTEAALIRLSEDDHSTVRQQAVGALARLGRPPSDAVRGALFNSTHDDTASVAVTALFGLARAGEPVGMGALAAVLTPEILGEATDGIAVQALEAAALAADPAVFGLLEDLRAAWIPADPSVARILIAALAWCAPPEWVNLGEDRPPFDRRLARWLTGKRVLIGMRHLDEHDRTVDMTQVHGEILRFQADQLLIRDLSSGEELDMPPDTRVFRYAPTGEYRLRSTGEVVSDPDAGCRWSVRPGPDLRGNRFLASEPCGA